MHKGGYSQDGLEMAVANLKMLYIYLGTRKSAVRAHTTYMGQLNVSRNEKNAISYAALVPRSVSPFLW